MYESQCVRGVFKAGERTKYDANKIKEQSECPHRFEDLKWGANGASIHASGGRCGARTVVQFAFNREKKNFMMIGPEPEVQPTELLLVPVPEGIAMNDTGCRAAVGGIIWHKALRSTMLTLRRRFWSETQEEYFQFGPGEPIRSSRRWIYDVGVLGRDTVLKISEVPVECPA